MAQKRPIILTIRLTKESKQQLIRDAAAHKMSVSAFSRKKLGLKPLRIYSQ